VHKFLCFTKYQAIHIEKDGISFTCRAQQTDEICVLNFGWGTLQEETASKTCA